MYSQWAQIRSIIVVNIYTLKHSRSSYIILHNPSIENPEFLLFLFYAFAITCLELRLDSEPVKISKTAAAIILYGE